MPDHIENPIIEKKQAILLYAAVSAIIFLELYFIPIHLAPWLYVPISFPHVHLESHVLLFPLILLLFLLSGKSSLSVKKKLELNPLIFHIISCMLFFAFLVYLAKIFPFKTLDENLLIIKLARIFNERAGALVIRYRIIFMALYSICHYFLVSGFFAIKRAFIKYTGAFLLTVIVAELSSTLLWKLLSASIAKANMLLLKACSIPAILGSTEYGEPMISTPHFSVSIAYTCSGLEGLVLFFISFVIFLFLDWTRINKKRALIVGVLGTFLMYTSNILRTFAIMLTGCYIDPRLAMKLVHTYAGMVIYALTIVLIFLASYKWMLKNNESSKN